MGFAVAAVAVTDAGLDASARLKKFAEAERLLVESQLTLQAQKLAAPAYQRDALKRLAQFYAVWNELMPDSDHAQKAAEWMQKLNELGSRPDNPETGQPP